MPDEAEAFVASLPVSKFHGVGPKTAAKMHALGIETGADLRSQSLAFLQDHFGKAGSWYFEIARGRDDRPVQPDRERKSSGSETTFPEDLIDPARIEAGVIAMADEVWGWCEKANSRGRTVTVKVKWANFQITTRSRSIETTIETRDRLREVALDLIRSVFPPREGPESTRKLSFHWQRGMGVPAPKRRFFLRMSNIDTSGSCGLPTHQEPTCLPRKVRHSRAT
jgi:DNA polymerase IV